MRAWKLFITSIVAAPLLICDVLVGHDKQGDGRTLLWQAPIDIASEDLFYGRGGASGQPGTRFTFVEEDLDGTNPKFVIRDEAGMKWKVKLGDEAAPETAASRFVWAMGYFTDADYFVQTLRVADMPRLHRGRDLIAPDGTVHGARLKRSSHGDKKVGTWKWKDDPFRGSREWNGLRVLMALINNWDLKDENNSIREERHEGSETARVYEISDLGASFGDTKLTLDRRTTKGSLAVYRRTRFIRRIADDYVDFETPDRPTLGWIFVPHQYFSRFGLEWIGRHIPREDARWMGRQLAQLSASQIRDAFRAAGYSPDDANEFACIVELRIAQLTQL
jgi:hypothetical protein